MNCIHSCNEKIEYEAYSTSSQNLQLPSYTLFDIKELWNNKTFKLKGIEDKLTILIGLTTKSKIQEKIQNSVYNCIASHTVWTGVQRSLASS